MFSLFLIPTVYYTDSATTENWYNIQDIRMEKIAMITSWKTFKKFKKILDKQSFPCYNINVNKR